MSEVSDYYQQQMAFGNPSLEKQTEVVVSLFVLLCESLCFKVCFIFIKVT